MYTYYIRFAEVPERVSTRVNPFSFSLRRDGQLVGEAPPSVAALGYGLKG